MKIALPVSGGVATQHFGHCEKFAIFEVDTEKKEVISSEYKIPPEHIPGVYPSWVASHGVTLVISGGMGAKAQNLFKQNGVDVILGVKSDDPRKIVQNYLNGTLEHGGNTCDDSGLHGCGR
jgi:predicted Fe-Mo cluster-binding NifX family protein